MRWELLTPPDFKRLAREEQICVLPIGSLERHGEHLPFGTDGLTAHEVACRAAEREPCVVFPPYWFGQVHEAACFTGAINLPSRLTLELLEAVLEQIAHNGFKKIVILNGHGGNNAFLNYFAMSNLEKRTDYTLYIIMSAGAAGDHCKGTEALLETKPVGHACEHETSVMMAIAPDSVKLEYQTLPEPILPLNRIKHLKGITSGLWWYADYPQQVVGCPSAATRDKGEAFLSGMVANVAEALRKIKDDTTMAELKQQFLNGWEGVKRGE